MTSKLQGELLLAICERWLYHPRIKVLIFLDDTGHAAYEIPLYEIKNASDVAGWISHLLGKVWVTPKVLYNLALAFDHFFGEGFKRPWSKRTVNPSWLLFDLREAMEDDREQERNERDAGRIRVQSVPELIREQDELDAAWAKRSAAIATLLVDAGVVQGLDDEDE